MAGVARADRVTVLPLAGAGVTKAELDEIARRVREATRDAGHTMATDAEQAAAEAVVRDGIADTRDEHTAAGRASKADWTVGGRVESRGHYRRIELEVCQVSSGRVESLARNIPINDERKKTNEMLVLLLRKEGITNAVVPWQNEVPPPPVELVPPPEPVAPPQQPKAVPPAATPPGPPAKYAEGRPFAIGAGLGALTAASRPPNASGNATTLALLGSFGYALEAVPGLEFRGELGAGLVAPRSVFFGAGARYAWMALPRARLYLGPEAQIGGFFPVGGDREGRFLLRGAPFVGLAIAPIISAEVFGDVAFAPGGTGALLLLGGGARVLVRF